jgi:hypothetical protein
MDSEPVWRVAANQGAGERVRRLLATTGMRFVGAVVTVAADALDDETKNGRKLSCVRL